MRSDVPELPLTVSLKESEKKRNAQIHAVVAHLHQPPHLDDTDDSCSDDENPPSITPVTGGLSNALFLVHSQYLVRVHPGNSQLVNRPVETALLHALPLAPEVYASFSNGRVEEFLQGYHGLEHSRDLVSVARPVAAQLAHLHTYRILRDELPNWWDRVAQWLQLATESEANSRQKERGQILEELSHEWKWIQAEFPKNEDSWANEVVLLHGDAQSLNVLVNNASGEDIRLIDYEYACYGPRAWDIANTWLEYADMNNLKADFALEYPSLQEQLDFLHGYDQAVDEATLHLRASAVNRYAILSHFQWTIWSLIQDAASTKEIAGDYDYLEYGLERWKAYHSFKCKFNS